jgi:hypothetical protein
VRGEQAARGYSRTSTDGTHELVVGWRRGVVRDFSAGEGYNLHEAADSGRNEQRRRGGILAYSRVAWDDVVRRWWDKMGLAHVVVVRSVGSAMDDDERRRG